MSKVAYVSSTYRDLKAYRAAVYKALRKIRYDVICMEDYVATDERTVDKCCAHAADCDLYIGIFGHRYGHVPPDHNPLGLSITEMEYRAARASSRATVRTFLRDQPEEGEPGGLPKPEPFDCREKLAALRREIAQISYGPFRTKADLVEQMLTSVYTAEAQARVEPGLDDIRSADMIPLEHSGLQVIETRIADAIKRSGAVAGLQVDLGSGTSWWSTRLYLVAALLEEYTAIPRIVFLGGEEAGPPGPSPYLGTCSPAHVRRALGAHFRAVDRAYRDSLPEQVFDAVDEVPKIVSTFAAKVGALAPGGERDVKRWVTRHGVSGWPGFEGHRIDVTGRKADGALLDDIVANRASYVALVRDGRLETLIDRAALATNLALRRH